MNKIIVPVDFSKHSEYALEAAAILAKQRHSEILVLHMLELSDGILTTADAESQAKSVFFLKLAEKRFEAFLKKDYLQGIQVTPIVKHYKVFSEVSEVAKEHKASLIVMGSHGTSGLNELFVGSNTERVVRNAELPVLVIKNKPQKLQFNNVVFACDFSNEVIDVYKKAKAMFPQATFNTLYVNLPTDQFKSTSEIDALVAGFFNKANGNLDALQTMNFVSDYSVERGVLNFANKIKADLIITPTHGRKGIAHFFEGSISEDIANHAILPVMTFKI
ncbi:MAG TPA: universal stress protein [Flavobacteriaceae bacterium]|nr:universal stress protein [Flavobacteriaceae bacterium]